MPLLQPQVPQSGPQAPPWDPALLLDQQQRQAGAARALQLLVQQQQVGRQELGPQGLLGRAANSSSSSRQGLRGSSGSSSSRAWASRWGRVPCGLARAVCLVLSFGSGDLLEQRSGLWAWVPAQGLQPPGALWVRPLQQQLLAAMVRALLR